MDYKGIIKSQKIRFKILKFLSFIPDSLMLKLQYRIKLGRKLYLNNPKRYTEKLQWYKLYYRNPIMTQCADKYEVRQYIKDKGLEHILNKLYGVYNSSNEITFEDLPNKFVIKTTNGSGTNVICKDKRSIDTDLIRKNLNEWLSRDFFNAGREWAYKEIKPRIIVEEYFEDNSNLYDGINDYKFMCFNGKVKYIVFDVDRYKNHKRNIYKANWSYLDVSTDHANIGDIIPRPDGLDEMLKVANLLAQDFPFVRVDLYWINSRVYFGELTFYPWAGYVKFSPDEFDFILGKCFVLPEL
ncbi:ATP-grasp fold amidoligase family protein [Paenibacillus sp. IITD108]|uniref:ATP-grasp fold amidoligase family protein n=1 Tax=Paenibacillus sp. IITD108 TaxID=3116649 RepID=UPI002F410B89